MIRPRPPLPAWLRPGITAAVLAWLAYAALTMAIQISAGVPYAEWFTRADHAWRVGVLSLAAGSLALAGFVALTRWNHLWRDPRPLGSSRAMRIAMALWGLAIALRLAGVDWPHVPWPLLLAVMAAGVLVGFAEETLFRGLLLRGLRQGGRAEAPAALWTAAGFGLFHLPNVFMGTGMIGLVQVVLAGMSGLVLYAFRRHFGRLWPAMLAHGSWDVSAFLASGPSAPWVPWASLAMQGLLLVAAGFIVADLLRHDRHSPALPPG